MNTTILDIPDEIIQHIFFFLDPEDIFSCALVCKLYNKLSQEEYLWENFYKLKYEGMPKLILDKNWKHNFMNAHLIVRKMAIYVDNIYHSDRFIYHTFLKEISKVNEYNLPNDVISKIRFIIFGSPTVCGYMYKAGSFGYSCIREMTNKVRILNIYTDNIGKFTLDLLKKTSAKHHDDQANEDK